MWRSIVWASITCCIGGSVWADGPTKTKPDPIDVVAPAKSPTPKERLQQAMRETAVALKSRTVEPSERAHFVELMNAAEALRHDDSVPQHERDKWRGLAQVRLVEGADAMRRQLAKPADKGTISRQFPAGGGAAASGAMAQSPDVIEAEKLIEIITTTVRPETWQDNGGQGVIKYWSLGSALIIYNTADVHERVSGFAGRLRP